MPLQSYLSLAMRHESQETTPQPASSTKTLVYEAQWPVCKRNVGQSTPLGAGQCSTPIYATVVRFVLVFVYCMGCLI